MAAKSSKEYVYLFIQPNDVNILEGFTTELKVMGVPRDNPNAPENVTRFVDFKVDSDTGDDRARVKVVGRTDEAVSVKGVTPGANPAELLAFPKKDSPLPRDLRATAKLWVDESDLLLYAPDGRVYWLPTKVWTRAKSFDPKHPGDMKQLAKALLPLLKNEAVVANIPHHVGHERKQAAGAIASGTPAEPVTCFLLNLNSILLSYTPGKDLDAQEQDASPFASRKF